MSLHTAYSIYSTSRNAGIPFMLTFTQLLVKHNHTNSSDTARVKLFSLKNKSCKLLSKFTFFERTTHQYTLESMKKSISFAWINQFL